nr:transposase [Scytonema sp. HK-05]
MAIVAVPPHYTLQDCSVCGTRVKKSLSTATHTCHECGTVMHRDHNATSTARRKSCIQKSKVKSIMEWAF